jgi:iron complex outermembrane receptor protein
MLSFTKALPANNQFQAQYFYTRSELTGWSGPMFYFFQMDPASPYFPTAGQLKCVGSCSGPPDLTDPIDPVWTDPNSQRYGGNINTEQRLLLTFSGNNGGWDYTVTGNYSLNKNINQNDGGYPVEYGGPGYSGPVLAPGGILSDLINPFGPQTAAGQSYINSTFLSGTYLEGTDRRISLGANVSHELGDAFNSGTPATFAFGAEVSQERFAAGTTDYNTLVTAATGLTDSSVEGSRQVIAAFMELDVPIAKGLDLDISDRQDRYSDFGTTNNPKIALRWQPISSLTFRGTASTGFRAPTLFDLYEPNSLAASTGGTMGSGNPDCVNAGNAVNPTATAPFTVATCNTQGLGLFGGNRALTPETSQNFDFGVVVSPIQDLGVTVDYYKIILKNTIRTIPAETIYAEPTTFANQYHVGSNGGLTPSIQEANACSPFTAATCGYILQDFTNTGGVTTSGVDLSIEYAQHTAIGTFHEDLEGTAVTQYLLQQYTSGPELNLVGWYNQNPPAYRWQHNLRLDWTSPEHMWGAGLGERFYSTYIDQYPDGNGNIRTVGSYSVWQGYVSVKPAERLTVLFGIKNLFDVSPPYTNAFQNNFAAGYNAFVVDPTQRSFYVNLKYKFF